MPPVLPAAVKTLVLPVRAVLVRSRLYNFTAQGDQEVKICLLPVTPQDTPPFWRCARMVCVPTSLSVHLWQIFDMLNHGSCTGKYMQPTYVYTTQDAEAQG